MTSIDLVRFDGAGAPIACTLTPEELQDRTASLSDLAARALTARETIDGGQRLRFIDLPDVERELRDAVAAESSCCSFLSMDLRRQDGALVLDVTGPEQARPIISELLAWRSPRRPSAPAR